MQDDNTLHLGLLCAKFTMSRTSQNRIHHIKVKIVSFYVLPWISGGMDWLWQTVPVRWATAREC